MTTLPPLNIRYPFDPTGRAKENLVLGETHTLPPLNQRIIVPRLGAFYANSLVVRHNEKTLTLHKDYEIAAHYHDASHATGQPVNVNIVFTNLNIIGEVEIDYQVVGGQFTGVWESIQQYVNVLLVDPRKVRWDDILDKPDFFVPKDHFHDINDVYGLNQLIPELQAIELALKRIKSNELKDLWARIMDVKNDMRDFQKEVADKYRETGLKLQELINEDNRIKDRHDALKARVKALEDDTSLEEAVAMLQGEDRKIKERIEAVNQNVINNYLEIINANGDTLNQHRNKITHGDITRQQAETLGLLDPAFVPAGFGQSADYNALTVSGSRQTTQLFSWGIEHHYIRTSDNPNAGDSNDRWTIEKLMTSRNLLKDPGLLKALNPQTNITDVYIDAMNGNDTSGDGTWQKPYRTLDAVFVRYKDKYNVPHVYLRIWLKENQTHEVVDKEYFVNNPFVWIVPYGPTITQQLGNLFTPTADNPYPTNPNLLRSIYNDRSNTRLTTRVRYRSTSGNTNPRWLFRLEHHTINQTMYCCSLNIEVQEKRPNAGRGSVRSFFLTGYINTKKINFADCLFTLPDQHGHVLDSNNLRVSPLRCYFRSAKITDQVTGKGAFLYGTGEGTIVHWDIDVDNYLNNNPANLKRLFPQMEQGISGWRSNFLGNVKPNIVEVLKSIVPISKKPYNQIKMDGDGLYFGSEPEPEYREVFVDALNGNDDNPGTRAKPFRTLYHAITVSNNGSNRLIRLYEGQDHILDRYIDSMGGAITIYPYGPRVEAIPSPSGGHYTATSEAHRLNTRISFKPTHTSSDARNNYIWGYLFYCLRDLILNFRGLTLQIYPHQHVDHEMNGTQLNGKPVRYGYTQGIVSAGSQGKFTMDLWGSTVKFVGAQKYENNNFLFNGEFSRGGGVTLNVRNSGDHPESISGYGLLFRWAKGNNCEINLETGVMVADRFRYYLRNFTRDANGNVDNLTLTRSSIATLGETKKLLPLKEELAVRKRVHFWHHTDTSMYYNGASGLNVGYIDWNGSQFQFSHPVKNNRGQVLGVSAAPGNQIQLRDDGFYLGTTAPPNVSNLYVSNQGNDSNDGTQAKPLRTLQEAFTRVARHAPGSVSAVHLKAGQQFEWPSVAGLSENEISLTVYDHGMKTDARLTYYRVWQARDYPRPVVNIRVREETNRVIRNNTYMKVFNAFGIHFKNHESQIVAEKEGHFTGISGLSDHIVFEGCILESVGKANVTAKLSKYRIDGILRARNIRFSCTKLVNIPKTFNEKAQQINGEWFAVKSSIFHRLDGTNFNQHDWEGATLDGKGILPNLPTLIHGDDSYRQYTAWSLIGSDNSNYIDRTNKIIRGITLNWDFWKYNS